MSFASHLESRRSSEGALRPMWGIVGAYIYFGADEWSGWSPNSPSSSVANSNGQFHCTPWLCRKDVTISGLALYVQTAAAAGSGSLARMGLYDDGGNFGAPGALLADAGSASLESSGTKDLAFGANYQLLRGLTYWIGTLYLTAGATNPTVAAAGGGRSSWRQGIDFSMTNNWDNGSSFLSANLVPTGALPNPAPTTGGNGVGAIQRPLFGAKIVSIP